MSIFGKVILDELTRRNPAALAYRPPSGHHDASASAHLPAKTFQRLLITALLVVGLRSAAFFYSGGSCIVVARDTKSPMVQTPTYSLASNPLYRSCF